MDSTDRENTRKKAIADYFAKKQKVDSTKKETTNDELVMGGGFAAMDMFEGKSKCSLLLFINQ